MKGRKLYFAYGANTDPESMAMRCPAAIPVARMALNGARLVFRGVADVVAEPNSKVRGVLWWLTPECEAALDRFEGFPRFYTKEYVDVPLNGKTQQCMIYVMTTRNQRDVGPPGQWYEETLRRGYAHFGITTKQIDRAIAHAERHQPPRQELESRYVREVPRPRQNYMLPSWSKA